MTGVLEVLLVHAKGIRRRNLVGRSSYYASIECGSQVYKSKVSLVGKDRKIRWNEKFKFEFPLSHWMNSSRHLKIKIMDVRFTKDGRFVGQTIIFLGGVIGEGLDRGLMEVKPTPYNVVLEDDTYKGQVIVAIKFTIKSGPGKNLQEYGMEVEKIRKIKSLLWYIMGVWRISHWWKLFSRTCLGKFNQDNEL